MDVRIVAATEVDPFEGALSKRRRLGERLDAHLAGPLHEEGVGGRDLLDLLRHHVEGGDQGGPFARRRHEVLLAQHEGRANARGIPGHERIAVAEEAGKNVGPVEEFAGLPKDAGEVEVASDLLGKHTSVETPERAGPHRRGEMVVLAVEEVAEPFEHHHGVGVADGIEAVLDETREQLRGIGQVEVARDRQIAAGDVVSPHEGVAVVGRAAAVGAVPQVADQHLAEHRKTTLEFQRRHRSQLGVAELRCGRDGVVEEPLDGVPLGGAGPREKPLPGRHLEPHRGEAGPVLTPIVLLLHQQVELPKPPQRIAVGLLEPLDRPQQSQHRHAALVADEFAHGSRRLADRCG